MKRRLIALLTLLLSLPAQAEASVPLTPSIHDWYHLSEGSDFFPTDWALALGLETRLASLGARPDDPATNPYLLDWVGVTTAWSDADPSSADALKNDAQTRLRWIGPTGRHASIKMSGINCAYCHTSTLGFDGGTTFVEGGAGMIDIEGFFGELGNELLTTMLGPGKLAHFLSGFGVRHAKLQADLFFAEFAAELGVPTLAELAKNKPGPHFYAKNEVVTRYLLRLLKLTHGISSRNADLGILTARMEFLGNLLTGANPGTRYTQPGWSRLDAFDGSANAVLRPRYHATDVAAPVSIPQLWNVSKKAAFEWEGLTNSILLRNAAQAVSLGAGVRGPQGELALNLHNLARLETWVDQFEAPRWQKVFGGAPGFEVNPDLARRGEQVFQISCATCHVPSPAGVGPAGALLDIHPYELAEIGTDPAAAIAVSRPIGDLSFGDAVIKTMGGLVDDYASRYGVGQAEMDEWSRRPERGNGFFRAPLLGWESGSGFPAIERGAGYVAGLLSGTWATAPYLHNGSVPSIRDLLEPASRRPVAFTVGTTEYDPTRLGYRYHSVGSCRTGDSRCIDTRLAGNSAAGHEFGTALSDQDKDALIEYLKILQ